MKFSRELQLNSVEDWRSAYVNYSALKKCLFAEEKRQVFKTSGTPGRKSGMHAAPAAALQPSTPFCHAWAQAASCEHGGVRQSCVRRTATPACC